MRKTIRFKISRGRKSNESLNQLIPFFFCSLKSHKRKHIQKIKLPKYFLRFNKRKLKFLSDPFTVNLTFEFYDSDNDTWFIFSAEDNHLPSGMYENYTYKEYLRLTKERYTQPFRKPSAYTSFIFNLKMKYVWPETDQVATFC